MSQCYKAENVTVEPVINTYLCYCVTVTDTGVVKGQEKRVTEWSPEMAAVRHASSVIEKSVTVRVVGFGNYLVTVKRVG